MAVKIGSSVPVYSLSDGTQMPEFLTERKRRQMQKDDESLRRRIELLQDFEYEGGTSRRARFSQNGAFIVTTGEYPPRCRVFEVGQLSMKYERRLGCECVDVALLTEDAGKLVYLLSDRTLDLHTPYGSHYKVRMPSHGRELAYDAERCVLYAGCAKAEVQRLDLDAGRFLEPLQGTAGFVRVRLAPNGVPLLAAGDEAGGVLFWDARAGDSPVARLDLGDEVTALAWDSDALTFAAGTSEAVVQTFDLRRRDPTHTKEHQYGLPIVDVHFSRRADGESRRRVLSADARIVKAWDLRTGDVEVNVETSAKASQLEVAPLSARSGPDSGLLVLPGEQPRLMTYFVPALGPAPHWCGYLDNITEELEETPGTAYDDYRFVSAKDIEELGAANLVGTPMLKAYMHGYFIEAKLYRKLKAVAEPFAYDDWRKEQQQKKLDQAQGRVKKQPKPKDQVDQGKLPKVNADLAQRILEATSAAPATNPLEDDRFAALFTDNHFQIDPDSPEYLLRHPNTKRATVDSGRLPARPVVADEPSAVPKKAKKSALPKKLKQTALQQPLGLDPASALGVDEASTRGHLSARNTLAAQPLGKRLDHDADEASSAHATTLRADDGPIREFTYIPKPKKPKASPGASSSATTDGDAPPPATNKKKLALLKKKKKMARR